MAKKVYKSVHTILDRVKKGELDFSSSPRLYSNIQYNVRGEIIKPYLHYLDERALKTSVNKFISDPVSHSKIQQIAKVYNKKLISPDTLSEEMRQIYNKFPKEIINDIFNINYRDIEKLTFEDRSLQNKFRYKMIEKANDPVTKIITHQNNIKSMVYTRSMIQYYLMMLAMLQQEDKEAFDEMMKNMQGKSGTGPSQGNPMPGQGQSQGQNAPDPNAAPQQPSSQTQNPSPDPGNGNGNNQPSSPQPPQDNSADPGETQDSGAGNNSEQQGNSSAGRGDKKQDLQSQLDTLMKKFEGSKTAEKILDEVMNNARNTSKMLDEIMTDKQMDELWEDLADGNNKEVQEALEKTNTAYLEKIERELKNVSISLTGIKTKIKSLLDKSISYFSSQQKPYFENILDAGTLDGLQDYELLHPTLRKLFMEDINVKDARKVGKIDIFVDCSGSMSESCGVVREDNSRMTKLLFAKAFAYKMKQMDLLNNIYSFQNSVKFVGTEVIDILSMTGGGGTYTNAVIEKINATGRNAIIITDAEDHCGQYSEKAFFIGVKGSHFGRFNPQVLAKYHQRDQIIVFDGEKVHAINERGQVI